jgi:hypothetical protein
MKLVPIEVRERKLRYYYGYAYTDKNLVELKEGMRPRVHVNTLIHEILHVLFPDLCETKIDQYASTITHHVWKYLKARDLLK